VTPPEPSSHTQATTPASASSARVEPGSEPTSLLDDVGIRRALMRIAHEIVERHDDLSPVYLVAIPNGGVPLGRVLVENIETLAGVTVPLGILDTTLYRDDVLATAERPPLRLTEMPSSVDERVVVLVEDVVNTGRTIRAAMDALMDFGRPKVVQVVALVDRGHRELPIKIDFVGKNIPTQPGEVVKLRGQGDPGGVLEGPLEVILERGAKPKAAPGAKP
jgi:pyrimidine operon attenuation protein/uracil phosphoribosyltransferase